MDDVISEDEEESTEETSESKEVDKDHAGRSSEEAKEHTEFRLMEQTYKEMVQQLEKMEGMENFINEYSSLFKFFHKTYFQEVDLMKEKQVLLDRIETYEAKLVAAKEIENKDKENISQLYTEIEQLKKLSDAAHAREQNAHEIIKTQKQQIDRLNAEIEERVLLGFNQIDETGSSKKDKENIVKERDNMMREMMSMKDHINNATKLQEELEKKNTASEQKCDELKQALEIQESEMTKEMRARERLESEIKHLTTELETNQTELENLTFQLSQSHHHIGKLEANGREFKVSNDRLVKEVENLNARLIKIQLDFDAQTETIEKFTNENYNKTHELKVQDEELTRLRIETSKIEKMREHYVKKLTSAQNQKSIIEKEKEKQKIVTSQLEYDLEAAKKEAENGKKIYEAMQREKDILSKNILKLTGDVYEQQQTIRLHEQVNKNLQIEMDSFTTDVKKLRKTISDMEKDRDKFLNETQNLAKNLQDTMDDDKVKEMAIIDYKKKLAGIETKLQIQQNLFETVHSDRNTFSKLLLEVQDENAELKQKLKVISHQTEQLKQDITSKETQLIKDELALQKSEKEKEVLIIELKKMKNELHETKEHITALDAEKRKFQKIIHKADKETEKQRKKMEQIMIEREILDTKMAKKNEELSILNEKVNMFQNILQKGEDQYGQRLEDVRLLKLEIKTLRQERLLLSKSVDSMTDMRQEIFHLERDLSREKLKNYALEEELKSPMNIHRWRKLEGSDPDKMTLIQKIQLLQKRLLVQAQNAIKHEAQLEESERLYNNLLELISRQPGPDAVIRLQKTQVALKERGQKMKCLISELNMFEAQVMEYKIDLQRTKDELKDVKKKYLDQKRVQQKLKERERQPANNFNLPEIHMGSTNHFMGGGFNISAGQKKSIDK